MQIMFPDYDHSLLSLVSSMLHHFGREYMHGTLPEVDAMLKTWDGNILVMLFDGLGSSVLEKHLSEDSFLRRHCQCSISSVFPPTTTAATISMETGLFPIEHGWLGWNLYFQEIDAVVNLFPNTLAEKPETPAAEYHVSRRFLPYSSVFEKIGKDRAHYVSPYSSYHCETLEMLCRTALSLCHGKGQYVYTYWPQPDYDMHDYGTAAESVIALTEDINRAGRSAVRCSDRYPCDRNGRSWADRCDMAFSCGLS